MHACRSTLEDPTDPEAFADALLRYYTDTAFARRHAKAARRAAERRFSLSRMVADYCNLYESTLAAAGIALPAAAPALRS